MKILSNAHIAVLIVLILTFITWFSLEQRDAKEIEKHPQGYHPSIFLEEKTFFDEILRANEKEMIVESVLGGVVPHHLLAIDIISGFFSSIPDDQMVERIVLIGPNHYERGNAIFTTSKYGWETPIDNVLPDISLINKLEHSSLDIEVNEVVMEQEHSIAGIIPFIAYYLPDAYVIPMSISRRANLSDLENLANLLRDIDNERTIFIASVDFSHYLSLSEAGEKDQETLDILKRGDLGALLSLDEANADSPESLALLLLLTSQQGIDSFDVLDHKNSADYTNEREVETTSYYSIVFTK